MLDVYRGVLMHAGLLLSLLLCCRRRACFVSSEAPRAAAELSFGPSFTKLRVEADAPSPDPYVLLKSKLLRKRLFCDFEICSLQWVVHEAKEPGTQSLP